MKNGPDFGGSPNFLTSSKVTAEVLNGATPLTPENMFIPNTN